MLTSTVTFDVITEMTMSRSFGLIKVGGDVDGLMSQMQKEMDYRGLVGLLDVHSKSVILKANYIRPLQCPAWTTLCA